MQVEVSLEKVTELFKDVPNCKVIEPSKIYNSFDEVFNSEYWQRIKSNFYSPDVKRKENVYRSFNFIKGYKINDKIYIHFETSEGELLFNELDIHSILYNGALNTITIVSDIIVYTKVNAENSKHNRDIYKKRGQTITKCYL